MNQQALPMELESGLTLRRGTPADAEKVADFNAHVHNDVEFDGEPIEWVRHWTLDLMSGVHPHVKANDFTIVFDGETVVSTMMLIPQTWTYEGIPFAVGRIELVGTHPDYRKRGLIRKQFDIIHGWCVERSLPVQSITGIPWYYRMFGYDMALELAAGRIGYASNIPELKKDEREAFGFRSATLNDLPLIQQAYAIGQRRGPLACQLEEDYLKYIFSAKSPKWGWAYTMIEDLDGQALGYIAYAIDAWGKTFHIFEYELLDHASWVMTFPAVLRWARQEGVKKMLDNKDKLELESLYFDLGTQHPCYELLPEYLPRERPAYGWYMRVPDLPAFLQHIQPVLESRLAASHLRGYSGELALNFYRSGVKLHFKAGAIERIEAWHTHKDEGSARFPDLTFLQMVFGFRTFEELDSAYPDCYGRKEAPALLNALFPRRASNVRPVQ
jgi:GNAT superfamily N-acetyltransferase